MASYIGSNPLSTFIEACLCFKNERDECRIQWQDEPGILQIDLFLQDMDLLRLDIYEKDEEKKLSRMARGSAIYGLLGFCHFRRIQGFEIIRNKRLSGIMAG